MLLVALITTACSGGAGPGDCDVAALRATRIARADRTELTVCGIVSRVGRLHWSRSGEHREFWVTPPGGAPIAIDANVGIMGDFPIRAGERAVVRGEYYVDPGGRDGIHWTHRTDRGSHPPGYVELDGAFYR